jgi:hypothetical protein
MELPHSLNLSVMRFSALGIAASIWTSCSDPSRYTTEAFRQEETAALKKMADAHIAEIAHADWTRLNDTVSFALGRSLPADRSAKRSAYVVGTILPGGAFSPEVWLEDPEDTSFVEALPLEMGWQVVDSVIEANRHRTLYLKFSSDVAPLNELHAVSIRPHDDLSSTQRVDLFRRVRSLPYVINSSLDSFEYMYGGMNKSPLLGYRITAKLDTSNSSNLNFKQKLEDLNLLNGVDTVRRLSIHDLMKDKYLILEVSTGQWAWRP